MYNSDTNVLEVYCSPLLKNLYFIFLGKYVKTLLHSKDRSGCKSTGVIETLLSRTWVDDRGTLVSIDVSGQKKKQEQSKKTDEYMVQPFYDRMMETFNTTVLYYLLV